MPEITQAELNQLRAYEALGMPSEIRIKISKLEKDNRKQREELTQLRDQRPKDGQVIVSKADADLLTSYRPLGTPEEIKGKLQKGEEATQKVTRYESRDAAAKFAKAAGIHEDAVDTLVNLPALQGAKFEVRKGKVKNEKGDEVDGDVAYLTLPGENQKATQFSDALETVSGLKGLKMAEVESPTGPAGRAFVPQSTGPGKKGGDLYETIREEAKARNKRASENKPAGGAATLEERLRMSRS